MGHESEQATGEVCRRPPKLFGMKTAKKQERRTGKSTISYKGLYKEEPASQTLGTEPVDLDMSHLSSA